MQYRHNCQVREPAKEISIKKIYSFAWCQLLCGLVALLVVAPLWATDQICAPHAFDKAAKFKQAAPDIVCEMAHQHLLLVGEIHGAEQTPAFVTHLVRDASKIRRVRLGIEFIHGMQPAVGTFMRSKGTQANREALFTMGYWANPDGRTSRAMKRLIEALRTLRATGRDVDIFTMKPDFPGEATLARRGGAQEWVNRGMADAIRNQLHDSTQDELVIAYMGNAHTIAGDDVAVPSVTARLKDLHPTLLVLHETGQSLQCQASKKCSLANLRLGPPMHSALLHRLPPIEGANAIEVAMPHYTSSPPVLTYRPKQ